MERPSSLRLEPRAPAAGEVPLGASRAERDARAADRCTSETARAGRGAVDGAVERLQGGLEREHERDHVDHVVEAARHRARRAPAPGTPSGSEAGAPAAKRREPRGRARRSPPRARRRRARAARERDQPQPRTRLQSSATNAPIPASIAEAEHECAAGRQQRLLGEQRLARDETPRAAARACSPHAPARRRRRRAARPRTSARSLTATTTANGFSGVRRPCRSVLLTAIGWPMVASTLLARVEVLRRRSRRSPSIRASCMRGRARRLAGDDAVRAWKGSAASPIRLPGDAESLQVSALQQRVDRLRGGPLDLFGEGEVAPARVPLRSPIGPATAPARCRCRSLPGAPCSTPRPGGRRGSAGSRRRQHVPVLDFGERVRAAGGLHGVDLGEQLVGVAVDFDASARRAWIVSPGGVSSTIATRARDGPARDAPARSAARSPGGRRPAAPAATASGRGSAGPCAAATSSARPVLLARVRPGRVRVTPGDSRNRTSARSRSRPAGSPPAWSSSVGLPSRRSRALVEDQHPAGVAVPPR